jgi:hypothetical protein
MVAAGNDLQAVDFRRQGRFGDGRISREDIVSRIAVFVPGNAKSSRGIGLGIAIDQETGQPFKSQSSGEVDCGSGFANPALLIDDRDYFTHA